MVDFIDELVQRLAALDPVRAVVMTGSRTTGTAGQDADVDLFVYVDGDIAAERRAMASDLADHRELVLVDVDPFGSGDVWRGPTGTWVDMVFWSPAWADDQLDRVLVRHEASLGYTTAFWRSIATAQPLYERDLWHKELQSRAQTAYPDELVAAIVELNVPWLADHPFSFRAQVEKALARGDVVSVNHRVAAWLASYFDVLFALNRVLHPGEKRVLDYVERECVHRPRSVRADVTEATMASDPRSALDRLVAGLVSLQSQLG